MSSTLTSCFDGVHAARRGESMLRSPTLVRVWNDTMMHIVNHTLHLRDCPIVQGFALVCSIHKSTCVHASAGWRRNCSYVYGQPYESICILTSYWAYGNLSSTGRGSMTACLSVNCCLSCLQIQYLSTCPSWGCLPHHHISS